MCFLSQRWQRYGMLKERAQQSDYKPTSWEFEPLDLNLAVQRLRMWYETHPTLTVFSVWSQTQKRGTSNRPRINTVIHLGGVGEDNIRWHWKDFILAIHRMARVKPFVLGQTYRDELSQRQESREDP